MSCNLYQSPIDLKKDDVTFLIEQKIKVQGKNKAAQINENKVYIVDEKVILTVDEKKYLLVEYHFHHFPNVLGCQDSEHSLDGKKYDAEIHYVFQELEKGKNEHRCDHSKINVCEGRVPENVGNLLVLGRFIKFSKKSSEKDLTNLQVSLPDKYFEYDGALTGENSQGTVDCAPVRWLVGTCPLKFNPKQFTSKNTKTTRCIQKLDGRIILYSC